MMMGEQEQRIFIRFLIKRLREYWRELRIVHSTQGTNNSRMATPEVPNLPEQQPSHHSSKWYNKHPEARRSKGCTKSCGHG